jgi:choline dehydrogenase-like flavoprotein
VGGGSLHYTANFWRFHEIDFIERSVLGAIPGTGFADWPITYADLEPYCTKVEWGEGLLQGHRGGHQTATLIELNLELPQQLDAVLERNLEELNRGEPLDRPVRLLENGFVEIRHRADPRIVEPTWPATAGAP